MESNKDVKSHIYISKGILRKYEDEKHCISYIEKDYKEILHAHPKSFNIEMGHFSRKNEDILNKLSEDKFSRLISKITRLAEQNKTIILSDDDKLTILKYLEYQIIRNDYVYEFFNNKHNTSLSTKFLKNLLLSEESKNNLVWNIIKDCNVELMINNTKSGFLLPITSTITLNSASKNDYILILFATPKIAFNFYANELFKKSKIESVHIIEESVRDMNLKILYILHNQNNNRIIGHKSDLELAIKSFNARQKTTL